MMEHNDGIGKVHKFRWYVKPKHYLTWDAITLEWKTIYNVVYTGHLVNFVAKDNANCQFAQLPKKLNTDHATGQSQN